MSWRDNLRQASFRGVEFGYLSDSGPVGRVVQIDEFPLRNTVTTEDIRAVTPTLSIEAVFVGEDYDVRRNAFMAALNQPGPGELIHPTLGRKRVTLTDATRSESSAEGGMASFSLTFVEEGEPVEQSVRTDETAAAIAGADALDSVATAGLVEKFNVLGKSADVLNHATSMVLQAQTMIDTQAGRLSGYGSAFDTFIGEGRRLRSAVTTLVSSPLDLATRVTGIVQGLRGLAATPADALGVLKTLMRFGSSLSPTGGDQAVNQRAFVDLVESAAAAEAVRAVTEYEFIAYQEAVAVRDDLSDAMEDAGIAAADGGSDLLWRALDDARLGMVDDVNARGADLAQLFSLTVDLPVPAIVLAHRLYGTTDLIEREADLVTRNAIAHPGLIPAGTVLEVLSNG